MKNKTHSFNKDNPTSQALAVADILLNGKKYLLTEYGRKTRMGIADLIDRKTAFPELLQAAKCAEADLEGYRMSHDIALGSKHPTALTIRELRAAIKIADPKWTTE